MDETSLFHFPTEEAIAQSEDCLKLTFRVAAADRQLIESSRREIKSTMEVLKQVNRRLR